MINPNQLYDYLANNNRNPSPRKMLFRVSVLLFGVKKSNILEKIHQKINYKDKKNKGCNKGCTSAKLAK